ncbi:protein FAM19A4-like isoform X2 [Carassius auratus]|uniref:Protein FAM19A4-like isoform X2 n=2 Tax=Cyprinidae TaxID=7953 RepID=A0A6P6MZC7_CARAU|nr:protein FAM19A4-like isoform X2 [Carassius auratus]
MLKAVRMLMLRVAWALAGAAICCFLIILIHSRFLREGQLAAGTCEIVTLDRDSSQPRRTIARQTARCACKKGQIAGTTRARPACVDARIVKTKQWCDMVPCLEDEGCDLLVNKSGWTCTQPSGRVKTTTPTSPPYSSSSDYTEVCAPPVHYSIHVYSCMKEGSRYSSKSPPSVLTVGGVPGALPDEASCSFTHLL